MSQLIILVGIPGAGKSTFAAQHVAENENTLIVNRDKLREMLFGFTEATVQEYYKHDLFKFREEKVTTVQYAIILNSLLGGKTVIVDDTNCNYERLSSLVDRYRKFGVKVKFIDTPVDECIRRNELRTRKVPTEAILKFYEGFLLTKEKYDAQSPEKPVALDEKGFVFLSPNKDVPYLIRMWEGSPWMFYWHPDKRWVSSRKVNQTEIWMASANKLPDDQAEYYHNLSERPF